MLILISVIFLLFGFISNRSVYTQNLTDIDLSNHFYTYTDGLSDSIYNRNLELDILFPKSSHTGLYFILDYYFSTSSFCEINVLGKTYSGIKGKIVVELDKLEEFKMVILLDYVYSYSSHTFTVCYIFGYSYFPYNFWYTDENLTINYNYADEFRMILNIEKLEEGKLYYFFNTFDYIGNPQYKLFENDGDAVNFDFLNFDGYLTKHDNGVLEFIKKDNKYKDVILYFIGNKTHTGSSYYGKSTANFAILYNYEIISFYPIIPIIVFPLIVILITGLLYWKFQYEKKPKPQPQQKQETELRQELIE